MCKFKEGLKLLHQLRAALKLTEDPRLLTQDMWSLFCYLPEGSHSIWKMTGWVKDWYCLGKFSLKGRGKHSLDNVYVNKAGYDDRFVWLPRGQDYVLGPFKPNERPAKPCRGVYPRIPDTGY